MSVDRDLMRYQRADTIAATFRERLSRPSVEDVTVIFDGMLPDRRGNMVIVRARSGTPVEELEEIVASVRGLIPDTGIIGKWNVRAYMRDGPRA